MSSNEGLKANFLVYGNAQRTFGEDTFTWTIMGASEVFTSWAGWLMVSASSTTNCSERANSKILSISLCTSAN